jgi:hypothetical protein
MIFPERAAFDARLFVAGKRPSASPQATRVPSIRNLPQPVAE